MTLAEQQVVKLTTKPVMKRQRPTEAHSLNGVSLPDRADSSPVTRDIKYKYIKEAEHRQ